MSGDASRSLSARVGNARPQRGYCVATPGTDFMRKIDRLPPSSSKTRRSSSIPAWKGTRGVRSTSAKGEDQRSCLQATHPRRGGGQLRSPRSTGSEVEVSPALACTLPPLEGPLTSVRVAHRAGHSAVESHGSNSISNASRPRAAARSKRAGSNPESTGPIRRQRSVVMPGNSSWPTRGPNVDLGICSTMRSGGSPEAKSTANEAVLRRSSLSVAVPDSACHAGGRGFESRRSRFS